MRVHCDCLVFDPMVTRAMPAVLSPSGLGTQPSAGRPRTYFPVQPGLIQQTGGRGFDSSTDFAANVARDAACRTAARFPPRATSIPNGFDAGPSERVGGGRDCPRDRGSGIARAPNSQTAGLGIAQAPHGKIQVMLG